MKDFNTILRTIGLNESEIKVYLALMERGPSLGRELSASTHLSKQGTYSAVQSLVQRGFVSSVLRGKKQYFQAESPRRVSQAIKRKIEDLKTVSSDIDAAIPELELKMGGEKPIVKLFEGKEGIRAIIDEFRSSPPKEVIEMTDLNALNKMLSPEDLKPLKLKLDQLGTKTKAIYFGQSSIMRSSTEVVFLEDMKGFLSTIAISDNKILLITFEGKMYSIILESNVLAGALKYIFERAYRSLKKER